MWHFLVVKANDVSSREGPQLEEEDDEATPTESSDNGDVPFADGGDADDDGLQPLVEVGFEISDSGI